MKKIVLSIILMMTSSFAYADSVEALDCFGKAQQLFVELGYYPEDGKFVPMYGQIVEDETGAVKGSGRETYSNYEGIRVVVKTSQYIVYAGSHFKLILNKSNLVGHLQATTEIGA